MPINRNPISRPRIEPPLTPETIAAWMACDFSALHCALGLKSWEPSPLPREISEGGCSADDLPENADSDTRPWVMELKRSLTLQHKLLSAVGWPTDCRAAYEANLRKAKQEVREARELIKHPERGGIGTGCDPVSRRERLAEAERELDYCKRLLAGLGAKDKATAK